MLLIGNAVHLECVVQLEYCGTDGVGRGEGYPCGGFEGVFRRIELGIDHVSSNVDVGSLCGEEMRDRQHQQGGQQQHYPGWLTGTERHRNHSTGHDVTKADCNCDCCAAGINCRAIRAAC